MNLDFQLETLKDVRDEQVPILFADELEDTSHKGTLSVSVLQLKIFQLVDNYKADFEASESCRRQSLKKFCLYCVYSNSMTKNIKSFQKQQSNLIFVLNGCKSKANTRLGVTTAIMLSRRHFP